MDKETLSNYGWIVICVLVLSVMIALATPFGSFISDAVQNTTEGLLKTEQNAMEEGLKAAGVKLEDVTFDDINTVGGSNNVNNEEALAPGLYDAEGNMTMTWEELLKEDKNIPCTFEGMGCETVFNAILKLDENSKLCTQWCCVLETESSEYINGKLVLDSSVKSIGDSAFIGCDGLTSIVIPDSVTSIDNYAFNMCKNLTSVNIPNSIIDIDAQAFFGCSNLTEINYNGTKSEWNKISLYTGDRGDWNGDCPEITVTCTDGTITIPATL